MKKTTIISTILSMLLIFTFISGVTVTAAPNTDYDVTVAFSSAPADVDLVAKITEGIKNYSKKITLEEYNLTPKELESAFIKAVYSLPDRFYVTTSFAYGVAKNDKTGRPIYVQPNYLMDEAEYKTKRAEFDKVANRIIAGITPAMTDFDKALYIHDEIAEICTFSKKQFDVTNNLDIMTSYDCLVLGDAVCQGYALAYNYVLSLAGVEAVCVSSDAMGHAWSMVKIDGEYYHVDVTWDDVMRGYEGESYDLSGDVQHIYFLCSDKEMNGLDHFGWDGNIKATVGYDRSFLDLLACTRVSYIGSNVYYIATDGKIYRAPITNKKSATAIYKIDDTVRWNIDGEVYYKWAANRAKMTNDSKALYINECKCIKRIDPASGNAVVCYDPGLENNESTLGVSVKNDVLIYDIEQYGIKYIIGIPSGVNMGAAADYSFTLTLEKDGKTIDISKPIALTLGDVLTLTASGKTPQEYIISATAPVDIKYDAAAHKYTITVTGAGGGNIKLCSAFDEKKSQIINITVEGEPIYVIVYGNVNGDDKINAKDVLLLRRYVAKQKVTLDLDAADCEYDGKINAKDVLLLRKFVAKQKVTLGKK